eukprot:m.54340 g.54340  ORF g.54340 m.54340 type:complete len:86 (+) comp13618_c0_seq2:770-1027(+)
MSLEEYATFLLTLAEHGPEDMRHQFAEHCVQVASMARHAAQQLSVTCLRTVSSTWTTVALRSLDYCMGLGSTMLVYSSDGTANTR